MATTMLKVGGMSCGHCVMAVTQALRSVPGVSDASVDLQAGRAVVQHDETQATARELIGAVQEEGYTAEVAG
jgi:copper chaperone